MANIQAIDVSSDEDLGRRVLAYVRVIAPCILFLDSGSEEGKTAVAILKAVAAEFPEAGTRRHRSMSRNGTSVSMDAVSSAFTDDDKASLRALCGSVGGSSRAGAPVGSFPKSDPTGVLWPEGDYS